MNSRLLMLLRRWLEFTSSIKYNFDMEWFDTVRFCKYDL